MATAEAGLELPIGLTEQRFMQQLARIEAKAIKSANAQAKAFANSNEQISQSFKKAEDSASVFNTEMDRLRTKYDPIYAASKRYEAAVNELNQAHKMGILNAKQYEAALEGVGREMLSPIPKGQRAIVGGNVEVTRSFGNMSRQATAQLQNVSFQLQDILVQVAGGQGLGRALGQQLPQLLGGFGALGAVLGVVAGAGIGLATMFMGAGEEAEKLDEKIDGLTSALTDYQNAVAAANVPTSELVDKYGVAAGAAQRLLEQLAQIAKLDAASALRDSASSIATEFESIAALLAQIDAETSLGLGDSGLVAGAVDQLKREFSLTVDQARELQGILTDQQAATTVEQQADAMLRMAEFLARANTEADYTNKTLMDTNRAAAEGALAANELAVALESAEQAAGGVLGTVDQLPGSIDAAAASAVNLARSLAAAIGAAQSLPGTGFGAPSLGRFGDGSDITRRAGGADLQEQQDFRANWLAQLDAASKGGGGGRKRSGGRKAGGGGKSGREERPFFENLQRDIADLERQLEVIGKTSEEVATMEARWAMLDEAKKRGITVNETLNGQIEAQAAQVGALTAELERAEIAQQQFDEAVEGIADAFAGAILAGESLREGLAQVFKQIASDILQSGIREALSMALKPQGQGGGWLGSLLGAIKLPSFDGGGDTGMGGRFGGIDGKGGFPAILHPNETVVDHSKGQTVGQGAVDVRVFMDENGNWQAAVEKISGKVSARMVAGNSRAQQDRQYLRNGR